jgi:hypothetical protein
MDPMVDDQRVVIERHTHPVLDSSGLATACAVSASAVAQDGPDKRPEPFVTRYGIAPSAAAEETPWQLQGRATSSPTSPVLLLVIRSARPVLVVACPPSTAPPPDSLSGSGAV